MGQDGSKSRFSVTNFHFKPKGCQGLNHWSHLFGLADGVSSPALVTPEVFVEPREPVLEVALLALADLGRNDGRSGQDVASPEDQED